MKAYRYNKGNIIDVLSGNENIKTDVGISLEPASIFLLVGAILLVGAVLMFASKNT